MRLRLRLMVLGLMALAACGETQTAGAPATGAGQQYAAQGGAPYAGYPQQGYPQQGYPPAGYAPQEDCMAMANQGPTMPTGPIDAGEALTLLQGDQARVDAMVACVYRQAAQDPRVQADWDRHRAQGGHMTLEQFATWHAQTAGGTRSAEWNATIAGIRRRDAAAMAAYRAGQPGSVFDPRSNDYVSAARGANHLGMQIVRGQDGLCYYQAYMEAGIPYQGGQAPCPPNG